MRIPCLAAVLSLAAPATAADMLDISLRLGWERPTDSYDVITDIGAGDDSRHAHWDSIDRFVAEALFGTTWLVYGFGMTYQVGEDESAGVESTLTRVGGRVMVGGSLPMGRWLHLELLPFAGIGQARYELDQPLIDKDSDRDVYLEWGGNLDLVFRVPQLLEIGLGAGWLASDTEFDLRSGGVESDVRIEEAGLLGRVFVAIHL